MAEVLISFQRPDSLTESEMRAWVTQRSDVGQPSLMLSRSLLRVEVDADTDEQLAELMLDMRLLGLRPAVVAPKMGTNTDTRG